MSCNHENAIPTRRVISSGITIVSLQCQRCGSGRAAKMSEYKVESLPDFDSSIADRYRQQIAQEWQSKQIQRVYEQVTKTGDWWQKYSAYLRSDHWRSVRRLVVERDRICQVCLKASSVQAHHLSYTSFNRYGVSFSVECVGVCAPCHDSLHRRDKSEGAV